MESSECQELRKRENVSGYDLGTPVIDKPMTSTHVFIYILPRKHSLVIFIVILAILHILETVINSLLECQWHCYQKRKEKDKTELGDWAAEQLEPEKLKIWGPVIIRKQRTEYRNRLRSNHWQRS
jgi:hypothetical protein